MVTGSASAHGGPGGGLRLSVFFGSLFLIYGTQLSYFSVWLDARGLTPFEIAVTSSVPLIIRLVLTPALGFIADRTGSHRELIIVACAIALLAMVGLKLSTGVLALIVLVSIMHLAIQSVMPLADTLTLATAREQGLDYGRIRSWGSLTFIVAGYIAGWAVNWDGVEVVIVLSVIGACLTLLAALWLPRPMTSGTKQLTMHDALSLARNRPFLLFMATASIIQSSHSVIYVFGVLQWREQGLSASFIATLWAIAVLAEIALFWGARWIAWIGPLQLIMIGAALGIIRWIAMCFDPSPFWLVVLQLLHAGTFAATHLGSMQWIAAHVPPATAGTAQALLSTFSAAIVSSGVVLLSGVLYAAYNSRAYAAMAMVCALGLAAGAILMRIEARRPLSP